MIELLFWFTATVFAANQGSVAVVTFPEEAAVRSMQLRWEEKKIPFAHLENRWETVVGIDLDTKPGDHEAEVDVSYSDGRLDKRPIVFRIDAVKFPTTELTVDDQYVQLSPANQQRAAREA